MHTVRTTINQILWSAILGIVLFGALASLAHPLTAEAAYPVVEGSTSGNSGGNVTQSTITFPGGVTAGANTITGIEVKLEISGSGGTGGDIDVALSWDGGTSWTTTKTTPSLTATDTVVSVGGSSDKWGRTWSASNFSNTNFRVRLTGQPSGNTVQIDALQVRVYHQSTGGGSGGGEDI